MLKHFGPPVLALLALCLSAMAEGRTSAPDVPAGTTAEQQQCVPFTEALSKVGQKACIEGTVVGVYVSSRGVVYLDFCEDPSRCPFSVVVFTSRSRRIGNLRTLKGAEVRITGKVKKRGHSAEIAWEKDGQLLVAYRQPPPPEKKKDKKHEKN